jgi:hypothetical protein
LGKKRKTKNMQNPKKYGGGERKTMWGKKKKINKRKKDKIKKNKNK